MRKFERLKQLKSADFAYLAVAVCELLSARIRFSVLEPQRIIASLQKREGMAIGDCVDGKLNIERVGWAIAVAGAHVPWRSDCLIQVMAADRWLTRHGLQGEFYLGVAKLDNGQLAAHAWLKWHGMTVTGGECRQFRTLIAPE